MKSVSKIPVTLSRIRVIQTKNTSVIQMPFKSCLNDAFLFDFLKIGISRYSSIAAWAAAIRAIGTRNGEQET